MNSTTKQPPQQSGPPRKETDDMTNAQIIFNSSIELMKEGIINGTGEMITVSSLDQDGNEKIEQIEMPEAIHTYTAWKQAGRQVKKGQKAKAQIYIWKYAKNKTEDAAPETDSDEIETGRMFRKLAFFFTEDQTEAITK